MVEYDELRISLNSLKENIVKLGDSLWPFKVTKWNRKTWTFNSGAGFLERFWKFYKNSSENQKYEG